MQGTFIVYNYAVKPILRMHGDTIDIALRKAEAHVDEAHKSISRAGSAIVPTIATSLTAFATQALINLEERKKSQ
jgi:hypothetical protein